MNRKKLHMPCADKNRYSTYERAIAVAVVRTEARQGAPKALRVYSCPHCSGFHLTSQVQHRPAHWPTITA